MQGNIGDDPKPSPGQIGAKGALEAVPVGREPSPVQRDKPQRKPLSLFGKILWVFIALFCGFWIVLPEPTDAIPILGWLDEGLAAVILLTSLSRLGIHIPYVDKWVNRYWEEKSFGLVGGKDKTEKPEKPV